MIFLTALSAPHQRVSGLDAGAVDYVTKPFDLDELRARIRSHLRQAQRQKDTLAAKDTDLARLEFSIAAALESANACQQELACLETCFTQAAIADYEDRLRDLVTTAKEDMRSLTQSLSRISKWFAAKRIR